MVRQGETDGDFSCRGFHENIAAPTLCKDQIANYCSIVAGCTFEWLVDCIASLFAGKLN